MDLSHKIVEDKIPLGGLFGGKKYLAWGYDGPLYQDR